MKYASVAMICLGVTVLLGGTNVSIASGFGSCELEAILLCSDEVVSEEDSGATELKFRVHGKPQCSGLGTQGIENGGIFTAAVDVRSEVEAQALTPGSVVRLRYDYSEGLTPDGFEFSKSWRLISAETAAE